MPDTALLLHPGFHKTGTTYLQESVFAADPIFVVPWTREEIRTHLIRPHDLTFAAERARASFDAALGAQEADGRVAVISEEGLAGNPYTGARESAALAGRLHAAFPQARVLLTVREQSAILRALYVQYLKEGGRHGPDRFFHPTQRPEFAFFDPATWCYHRLAAWYAHNFGADRVLVLPQELLARDEPRFMELLTSFLGVLPSGPRQAAKGKGANVSPPLSGAPALRAGNRFMAGPFNETAGLPGARLVSRLLRSAGYRGLPGAQGEAERVMAAIARLKTPYAQSNRELQEFCPVDLKALGYPLA